MKPLIASTHSKCIFPLQSCYPSCSIFLDEYIYFCVQFQKRQNQVNAKSRSEMFNPSKEDSASGFPIEPPRPTHPAESSQDSQRVYTRTFHSGPLVNQNKPSKAGRSENGDIHLSGVANASDFRVVVSTRSNISSDNGNGTVVTQAEAFPHERRLSESINERFSSSGKYDQVFQQKDDRSSRVDGAIVSISRPK